MNSALNEIISHANLALEDKKRISRAGKPSYIEEHETAPSKDASYLADSVWANIESVESMDPYPGQAKSVNPYPGEAETEGSNKEPSPPSTYNETGPGRLCSAVISPQGNSLNGGKQARKPRSYASLKLRPTHRPSDSQG